MRTLYDSITASDIPLNAQMVGGYVDGAYQWSDSDWARFPNAQHVGIAVSAGFNGGQVLDVETGDATADQAPGWVRMRRNAGQDPTIYTSYSAWWGVRQAFINAGVAEPHYWIALWDDSPVLLSGAVAKQYIDPPLSGGHYDLSIVADSWPGVDGVLGPGGGSLTGDDEFMALIDNPTDAQKAAFADFLLHWPNDSVTIGRIFWALGISQPADASQSRSATLAGIAATLASLQASAGSSLTPTQAQQLSDVQAAVGRIEAALKGA